MSNVLSLQIPSSDSVPTQSCKGKLPVPKPNVQTTSLPPQTPLQNDEKCDSSDEVSKPKNMLRDLQTDWVDLYSTELLAAADGAETKHNITGAANITLEANPSFSFTPGEWCVLNGPAQGTTMQSRLGNQIRCKSAHIKIKAFIDSTDPYIVGPTASPLPFGAPWHIRCRIFWDTAPTQISAIYPVAFSNNTIPGSVNALHGEFLLGDQASNVAPKHWLTNKRYEIVYDKVFPWSQYSCCTYGQATGNKETVLSGSHFEEIHLDLKGKLVQFSDTTANTFINNALIMVFTSDLPAGTTKFIPCVTYLCDFQFFDPQ